MKDEENRIFEEWFEEKKENCEVYGNGDDFWVDDEIKKFCLMGYELGLKAGRPQWHDLRKDPNDLPKGQINRYLFGYVKNYRGKKPMLISYNGEWFYDANTYNTEVKIIAWCEIPTFDKE